MVLAMMKLPADVSYLKLPTLKPDGLRESAHSVESREHMK